MLLSADVVELGGERDAGGRMAFGERVVQQALRRQATGRLNPRLIVTTRLGKVEIGGDVNSTCGTEPAFAHTREEFLQANPIHFKRGYEVWLMVESKRRNPEILLDALVNDRPAVCVLYDEGSEAAPRDSWAAKYSSRSSRKRL